MIHLLNEREDVAGLTTAKAVKGSQLGTNVEGRTAFVVERAQALIGTHARRFERDVGFDDLAEVDAVTHLVDVFSFNQPCHDSHSKKLRPA